MNQFPACGNFLQNPAAPAGAHPGFEQLSLAQMVEAEHAGGTGERGQNGQSPPKPLIRPGDRRRQELRQTDRLRDD